VCVTVNIIAVLLATHDTSPRMTIPSRGHSSIDITRRRSTVTRSAYTADTSSRHHEQRRATLALPRPFRLSAPALPGSPGDILRPALQEVLSYLRTYAVCSCAPRQERAGSCRGQHVTAVLERAWAVGPRYVMTRISTVQRWTCYNRPSRGR
jgi:hypothetical protein